MNKLFLCICLLAIFMPISSFSYRMSKTVKETSSYANFPAKLITTPLKLHMLQSIKDLDDGRLFFLDYTVDYKLEQLIHKNIINNEELIQFILDSLCDKKPIISSLNYGVGCSAFSATTIENDYIMGRNLIKSMSLI